MKKIVLMASVLLVICQGVQGMNINDQGTFDKRPEQSRFDTLTNAQMIEQGFSAPQPSNDSWKAPKVWPIEAKVYAVGAENLHQDNISMMFTPKNKQLFAKELEITKKTDMVYSPVPFNNFKFPQTLQIPSSKQQVKYLNVTSIINTLPETVQYVDGFHKKAILGITYLNNFLYYCGNQNYEAARGMLAFLQGQKAVDFGCAVRPMLDEDAIKNVIEVEITWADGIKGNLASFMVVASAAAGAAKQHFQKSAAELSNAVGNHAAKMTKQAQYEAANFAGKCNIMIKKHVGPWRGMAIGATVMFLIYMRFMRK